MRILAAIIGLFLLDSCGSAVCHEYAEVVCNKISRCLVPPDYDCIGDFLNQPDMRGATDAQCAQARKEVEAMSCETFRKQLSAR